MPIILSTGWYCLKAKFDYTVYQSWMDNMLSNVNNYYLVVYTNAESYSMVSKYSTNPRIKIVIKEIDEFHQYRHKENWIQNHTKNTTLNTRVGWQVNMLWAEKIHFVRQTAESDFFGIEPSWYGWCDIGYFREHSPSLGSWPTEAKLEVLDKTKIHYGVVNSNMIQLIRTIKNKNENGLPKNPIPPYQISVAGGFFLITKKNIDWWANTFDHRLTLYFDNGYLVKDDQMIIIDCIISDNKRFKIHFENLDMYDNWFMFQRILL